MRLLLSCVSENTPEWFQRVENLVLSVRGLGGRVSEAPFIVNFVGAADPAFTRALEEHGAAVRVVDPFVGNGLANKLRMLDLQHSESFDVLVALDCDVVVVDDFSPHVPSAAIAAKPVDYERFADRDWERLYGAVGLRPPAKTMRATSTGRAMPPYFNSGVLTVPREFCEDLRREWSECYSVIHARVQHDPDWLPRNLHWLAEQSSLALAIARGRLPFSALPLALNFPTHVPVHRSATGDPPNPAILHYHGEIDPDGFLIRPRSRIAAEPAERFNALRAERLELPYAGMRARPLGERVRRTLIRRVRGVLARRQRIRSLWQDRVRPSAGVLDRGRSGA